jgi:hypothetical protein
METPMVASQSSSRRCPTCHSDLILKSRSQGTLQDLYVVLGGELCRCRNCEARHAFVGPFVLRLGQSYPVKDTTNFWWVGVAIFLGIAVCLAVAVLILRRFHRFPF